MEGGDRGVEKDEEEKERAELLRDRFRLAAVSIAEAEAKKQGMDVAEPVVACIADLALKFSGSDVKSMLTDFINNTAALVEQLAKDLEQFAQHAGRKSVTMEDVILSAHRNEHLASLLRSFSHELKMKEPQKERKRKKKSVMEDSTTDG